MDHKTKKLGPGKIALIAAGLIGLTFISVSLISVGLPGSVKNTGVSVNGLNFNIHQEPEVDPEIQRKRSKLLEEQKELGKHLRGEK